MGLSKHSKPMIVSSGDKLRYRENTEVVCRFCGQTLEQIFVDLGMSPLANSYLTSAQLHQMEPFYPLRIYVCRGCLLVQAEEFESSDSIFGDYAYFASYSDSLASAREDLRRHGDTAIPFGSQELGY